MRWLVAGISVLAVLVLAGGAFALNTYTVGSFKTSPSGKGSPTKPRPKALTLHVVGGSSDGVLPQPTTLYRFNLEGIKSYARLFPRCTLADAQTPQHAQRCAAARVGSGNAVVKAGKPGSSLDNARTCPVSIILYNIGNGLAQRLDSQPEPRCPLNIHAAVPEIWETRTVERLRSASLKVEAPPPLLHPAPGINAFVSEINLTIDRVVRTITIRVVRRVDGVRTVRRVRRKVGYLSSVGCNGRRRAVTAFFRDETGKTTTVIRTSRC